MTTPKCALILGGTGESGKRVLDELRASDLISKIIMLNRREIELPEGNGKEKVQQKLVDFDKLDENKEAFNEAEIAFCCLGTTRGKAGKEGFIKVDYDYVVNSAKILKEIGTCNDYHLISSWGKKLHSKHSEIDKLDKCLSLQVPKQMLGHCIPQPKAKLKRPSRL